MLLRVLFVIVVMTSMGRIALYEYICLFGTIFVSLLKPSKLDVHSYMFCHAILIFKPMAGE